MEKTKIIDIPEGCKQIQVTETEIKFLIEKEIEQKMPPVMINKDSKFTSLIITGNKTIAFIRNSDVKFMTIPKDEYDLIYDWIIQDYKNKIQ